MGNLHIFPVQDEKEVAVLAELTPPQSRFYLSSEKYPLFCGGMGSGKSTTMSVRAVTDLIEFPGANIGCYAPTYDLLKLITEPFIAQRLTIAGLNYSFNKSDHIFSVEDHGSIICRSLSTPERIIGYEVFRSHVDELDTLKDALAEDAWNKVVARNRQKIYVYDEHDRRILKPNWKELDPRKEGLYLTEMNRVCGYTTPEGFKFCYKKWKKKPTTSYGLYKVDTYSNQKNLPDGYIEGMLETYPSELIDAYLNGEFTNLRAGRVYPNFDRGLNNSTEVVVGNEPLCVGMDFNVLKGAAGIHVLRNGVPHCVDQIHNAYDTDAQIATLKDRYPGNPITVYPDPAGKNRTSSNTTATDIAKLKAAGYRLRYHDAHPPIKDRVAAVNAKVLNGKGERTYFVNSQKCPDIVAGFEQQVYDKNGQPDKEGGHDHPLDAVGYYLEYEFGIVKPIASVLSIEGGY